MVASSLTLGPRRGKMDLTIGFVKATSDRMQRCFDAFLTWVETEAGFSPYDVVRDMQALAWLLRGYGMHLFEHGQPRYLLVYAITAAQVQRADLTFQLLGRLTRSGNSTNQDAAERPSNCHHQGYLCCWVLPACYTRPR